MTVNCSGVHYESATPSYLVFKLLTIDSRQRFCDGVSIYFVPKNFQLNYLLTTAIFRKFSKITRKENMWLHISTGNLSLSSDFQVTSCYSRFGGIKIKVKLYPIILIKIIFKYLVLLQNHIGEDPTTTKTSFQDEQHHNKCSRQYYPTPRISWYSTRHQHVWNTDMGTTWCYPKHIVTDNPYQM